MEENRNENSGEVAAAGSGLRSKLENFWYYYKWHTIAAAFLIIAILVCSLQMCSKVAVDFQLMYAGGTSISRQSVGGDVPAYNQLCSLIADYVDDVDGDGHKNIAFATYYLPSPDEIKAIEADGGEVSYSLMEKDEEAMESRFGIGDYYASSPPSFTSSIRARRGHASSRELLFMLPRTARLSITASMR